MTGFVHARWPLLHEDNHLLVVYKPAGLLSQGDASGADNLLDLCKSWLKMRYAKPGRVFLGLVHRLDRPVAGVMAFARTSKAAARLSAQIRERRVRKLYLAVVEGRLPAAEGRLCDRLVRTEHGSRVAGPAEDGSEARLSYRVQAVAAGRSLVTVELETGRKHQIRVQLTHAGCPVAGDVRYGAAGPLPGGPIALFARELELEHPTRPERLTFTAPLPAGWPWDADPPDPSPRPLWCWDDYGMRKDSVRF
jgi:23S rRNA pseudouridine1911/1915/1917 synthase